MAAGQIYVMVSGGIDLSIPLCNDAVRLYRRAGYASDKQYTAGDLVYYGSGSSGRTVQWIISSKAEN